MEINIKNLTKKLGDQVVLNDISLKFENGKIYGLIGRNGSGKTMLLKSICGFVVPDSGSVVVDGVDIYEKATFPKSTAALLDHPNYLPDLTGYENLKMLANIQNIIGDEEILKTLEDVNLIDEKDKQFKKYSMGMKQKLGIAQVLMEDPSIMIFDEPFNGLEDESASKIRELLKNKKKDKIIIISTHIKEDIESLCDEIYTIKSGSVVGE